MFPESQSILSKVQVRAVPYVPDIHTPIIIPIQHDVIERYPQLQLKFLSYPLQNRWKRIVHRDCRSRVFEGSIGNSRICCNLTRLGECTAVHF
jgi:hypothetical protein